MIQKCGDKIFSCYADTECRTALNCLNACHFNDQVGACLVGGEGGKGGKH